MPTLLQINVDANNGSNGSIARDIGTMALAKGWKSYIAYGRRSVPCDSQLIRVGNNIDVRLHGAISRLFDLHGLGSNLSTVLFIRKVKRIKPDIVHLHNIHGYYINYRILFNYLKRENIPIVWTFHDCWPFTGHCGYFEAYNCDKWKDYCHQCPGVHDYPASWIIDNSKYNFKLKKKVFTSAKNLHITTVSSWLSGLVKQSFFVDYPITVVYDSVDTRIFQHSESNLRKEYGLEGKLVLMSAAANWTIAKGWNDYIKLSQILPEDCVIMLLGVKDDEMGNLPKEIIGVPRVEGKKKLAEYYSMADVLLNLSYQETFGMTTAEAMSCGTPGISYNATACPELLTPDTGIVVEAGNLQQVLTAISTIKSKGKESYSHACRERALNVFDSNKVNSQFFYIYNKILNLE